MEEATPLVTSPVCFNYLLIQQVSFHHLNIYFDYQIIFCHSKVEWYVFFTFNLVKIYFKINFILDFYGIVTCLFSFKNKFMLINIQYMFDQ